MSREFVSGRSDIGTGPLGVIGNIIWLVLAGWWLALGHVVTAVLLAVTIVGIPFAWAHLKLAGIALWADRQGDRTGVTAFASGSREAVTPRLLAHGIAALRRKNIASPAASDHLAGHGCSN